MTIKAIRMGANGAMRVYRKKDGTRYLKLAPCQGVLVVVQ